MKLNNQMLENQLKVAAAETELRPMLTTENQFVDKWHDTLIGSSEQCERIKSEQDNAYLASLAKDEADDEARREAI